jgi:hypothetical protein
MNTSLKNLPWQINKSLSPNRPFFIISHYENPLLVILLLCLPQLFQGCAVYMPASEGIIYHDQDEEAYGVKTGSPFPLAYKTAIGIGGFCFVLKKI